MSPASEASPVAKARAIVSRLKKRQKRLYRDLAYATSVYRERTGNCNDIINVLESLGHLEKSLAGSDEFLETLVKQQGSLFMVIAEAIKEAFEDVYERIMCLRKASKCDFCSQQLLCCVMRRC